MALTPGLQRALEAAEIEAAAALKTAWAARVRAILAAVEPPLSPIELSLGLGVDAPLAPDATGARRPRTSTVSKWLSTAPRHLRAVPDAVMQALIARLEQGHAVMAVARVPGADGLRAMTFAEPWEVARLPPELAVVRLDRARAEAELGPELDFTGGAPLLGVVPRPTPPIGSKASLAPPGLAPTPTLPRGPIVRAPAPTRRLGPWELPPLGLGAMRLATAGHPPEAEGIQVLRRAFELGVRLVDTADSYGVDHDDMHAGERQIRIALAGWPSADRGDVVVATKCGLVRPGGRWLPDGRPEHLLAACDQSLLALAVERLDLLQLHVKDPKVPFTDSLGALAELHRAGKVAHLGLCNVSAHDLWTALRVLPPGALVSVQNELSPFEPESAVEVLALTRAHGLAFLAHRALGGHRGTIRITKRPLLYEVAARHHTSPQAVVLAWLRELAPHVIPLFGATRVASVESSAEALELALGPDDIRLLDEAFPAVAALRDAAAPTTPPPEPVEIVWAPMVSEPLPEPGREPEVVMMMGIPGAGKSSLVAPYLAAGYARLNRDDLGGTLDGLIPRMRNLFAAGRRHIVLDNTYPTRRSRAAVIAAAREAGLPVRLLWLDTPLPEARWNACLRMLERYGRLLSPEEIKIQGKTAANTIPPRAQTAWLEQLEAPSPTEGLDRIERRPFVRHPDAPERVKIPRALLLDVDGTLRRSRAGELYPRSPDDVVLLPGRREVLARWQADGYALFFVSNQSGVHSGRVARDAVERTFARTIELLGLPVLDVAYCPHSAFPVGCFCRKPMPGLAAYLVWKHGLARDGLVVVGDQRADQDLAAAIGARFIGADTFFAKGTSGTGGATGARDPSRRR